MKIKSPSIPVLFIVLIITIFQLLPKQIYAQDEKINVALLSAEDFKNADIETKAAYDLLKGNSNFIPAYLTFKQININPDNLKKFDVIWFHRPDTSNFLDIETDKKVISALRKYVENGGNLLLTLDAFGYIINLGLESVQPQVRNKKSADKGYGRKLGLHCFRSHPVFDGLNGGAYIYKPHSDITVRQIGYFNDSVPENGKVVAVDWDYIFVRENSKLILEYDLGKGKIIAVGAYTYYAPENYNFQHLKLFTENIINYLTNKNHDTEKHYWDYKKNEVLPFELIDTVYNISKTFKHSKTSDNWETNTNSLTLTNRFATDNYWEVAGQRILIMGNEKGGIDEIWAHPFMSLRDYEVGIKFSYKDTIYWLNDEKPQIEVKPESFTRTYKFARAYLKEILTADITEPTGIIHYEYRGVYPADIFIKFKSNFRYMWPYSERVLSTIFYTWDNNLNAFVLTDKSGDFVSILGSDKIPSIHKAGRFDGFTILNFPSNKDKSINKDSIITGIPTDKFQASALMEFNLKMNENFDIILCATNEGLKKTIKDYTNAASDPEKIYKQTTKYTQDFFKNALKISTPDNIFNEGYRWALIGSDRFFVNTPGLGKSLVAGYSTSNTGWWGGHKISGRPGYGWYFGRDAEWSGFALLDYGDFDKVKSILKTFNKFQDLNGKIYHEMSTSGFVHYDASDATPLYIILVGKYLKYSGDIEFIRKSWHNIKKAIDFCFSTDTDKDHLIENTNVGHGWVEGGSLFGSHSSLYLVACWAAALDEACYMAENLGFNELVSKYKTEAETVKKIINEDFWNTENNFFYHGKFKDGTYHTEPTILAAIPLYYNMVDSGKVFSVLSKYAGNNFTSDWGSRIVGEDSPLFHPEGYHTGSVWPLFTGWSALAEYNNGNYLQGFSHVMNNLLVYKSWGLGYVEEVLNGRIYEPSGVCHHQCWSETMVLQPIIEGMLGIEPDAMKNKLSLSPRLPVNWDFINVENIKVGDNILNYKMIRSGNKTTYTFKHKGDKELILDFSPSFPPLTKIKDIKINGVSENIGKTINNNFVILQLPDFYIKDSLHIEIFHSNGISVLPVISNPKPGYKSEGLRIISTDFKNNEYTINLQAKSGSAHIIQLYVQDENIIKLINCKILNIKNKIYQIEVDFEESDIKYLDKTVKVYLGS